MREMFTTGALSGLEHYQPGWNRLRHRWLSKADKNARQNKELEWGHEFGKVSSHDEPALVGRFKGIFGFSTGFTGIAVALALCHGAARADSLNSLYHGRDLGLPLADAIAQVQATGASQSPSMNLSISGSGNQLMFTEVFAGAIETETASVDSLSFDEADVRKIGQAEARYGIVLRAAPNSVNDHITVIGAGKPKTPDHDTALGYMDFWLADADTVRVRHLSDLFATIEARLKEHAPPARVASVAGTGAGSAGEALGAKKIDETEAEPKVLAAPPIPVVAERERQPEPADTSDTVFPTKCLFREAAKLRHGRVKNMAPRWSDVKEGKTAGYGRLSYKLSPLRGADDHQAITFYLSNLMPVAATLIARVILTSNDGSQQAEDLGLDAVPSRSTVTDPSLTFKPFNENACITDIDVTEVQACPVPDDNATRTEPVDVYRCGAEAAAGTVTVNGITYISGREPKMLSVAGAAPQPK